MKRIIYLAIVCLVAGIMVSCAKDKKSEGIRFIQQYYDALFSEDYDIDNQIAFMSDELMDDYINIAEWEDAKGYIALDADYFLAAQDLLPEWKDDMQILPTNEDMKYLVLMHSDTIEIWLKQTEEGLKIKDVANYGQSIHDIASSLDWTVEPNSWEE